MSFLMKALKTFNGEPGEGQAGFVSTGCEFRCANQQRANDLESHGLAVPIPAVKAAEPPLNKMAPAPMNKAADAGPLASVGGETGEEPALPLSDQDHPQQRRRGRPLGSRNKDASE